MDDVYSNLNTGSWLRLCANLYTEESTPVLGVASAPVSDGTACEVARISPLSGLALPDALRSAA